MPLLVLSGILKFAAAEVPVVSFLKDLALHVRFLLALPVLIVSERFVQFYLNDVVALFQERQMVTLESLPKLLRAKAKLEAVRKSILMECGLLFVAVEIVLSRKLLELPERIALWRSLEVSVSVVARNYYLWVSLVIYHLFLLRWICAFGLWSAFIVRASQLKLELKPQHPDRVGGLSFLTPRHLNFVVIPLVMSMIMSANVAQRVFHGFQDIDYFRAPLLIYVAIVVVVFLAPVLAFTPALFLARWRGLRGYGSFATDYIGLFNGKWLGATGKRRGQDPLGSSDIQSLSDLMGSYDSIGRMRVFLLGRKQIMVLIVITVLPLLPLLLFKVHLLHLLKVLVNAII